MIEFSSDFTGSTNIELDDSPNQLIKVTPIMPFSNETVAILKMKKHW
jgi:hypothetical protein